MVEPVAVNKLIARTRSAYRVKGSERRDHDRQKGDFYEEIARVKDGQSGGKEHSSNALKGEAAQKENSQGQVGGESGGEAGAARAKKEKITEQGKLLDIIA